MIRSVALLVAALLGLSACSVATPPGSGSGTVSSGTPGTSSTQGMPQADIPEGLSAAFLAYRYPVDGADWALGWRTYELPIEKRFLRFLGACVVDAGYRALGRAVREAKNVGVPSEGWLFPDLDVLRQRGFEWDDADPALSVIGSVSDMSGVSAEEQDSSLDILRGDLERWPQFGIPATIDAARGLNDDVTACEVKAGDASYGRLEDADLGFARQWLFAVQRMETDDAEVSAAAGDALVCARQIDPLFADASSLVEWLAMLDGESINLDYGGASTEEVDAKRRAWGQAYGVCVGPLVEVRRRKRLVLREQIVNEQLPQLLEIQARLDAALDEPA
ncbi:MAG: hypothetical protein GXP34_10940, partial [Actinobacteria bacterium]|nr:hypothetical protein [Actinomycetota bacterium]